MPINKKIKEAILKNHGGLTGASDSQIMTIWNALAPADQRRYLEPPTKPKGPKDAVST